MRLQPHRRGDRVPRGDAHVLHHRDPPGDPRHIAAGRHVGKDAYVETQRILNAAGLAVPNWPVEWGGRDWTPLQRHIWHEEMQLACVPPPLAFNANMVGPVIANFGSQELKERFLPPTANLDIWWCPGLLRARTPAPTSRRCAPPRARRRRLGRQRAEDLDHARPVRRLDLLPRAHRPGAPSASSPASRSCWSTMDHPGRRRCGRSS